MSQQEAKLGYVCVYLMLLYEYIDSIEVPEDGLVLC